MYKLLHICKEMSEMSRKYTPAEVYNLRHGQSISYIEFDLNEKVWVAHCDEYGNVIIYCPFCGIKLPKNIVIGAKDYNVSISDS